MKKLFLLCISIIICRLLAAYILPTFDDAFITYRYSNNLVSGNGFVYNINEKVMGTTAPLFALLACIPIALSIPVAKFFVAFNLLCDLGTFYLIYKYFLKKELLPSILFAFFFAAEPHINRISIGGMEANLFCLASLSGIVLYLNNKRTYAVIVITAAYFLRPEAVILMAIIFVHEIYTTKKIPLKHLLISLAVLLIPLLVIYLYYGQILPQSVVAKGDRGRARIDQLLKNILFPNPLYFGFLLLSIISFINFRKNKYFVLTGTWAFLFITAYFVSGAKVWTWYVFSIEVVLLAFSAALLPSILQRFALIKNIKPEVYYVLPVMAMLAWFCMSVYKGRSHVEKYVYSALDKDFDTLSNRKLVFLADDIGALGYFTKAYIYDNLRLVTPEAADFKTTYERIISVKPDYLFLYTMPRYTNLIKNDSVLSANYYFLKRYSVNGDTALPVAYKRTDSIGYRQDYILYKRK